MRQDVAFGVIPVFYPPGNLEQPRRYLLILHNKGHWGFPKGHADPGETERETAQRELREETGLTEYTLMEGARFVEQYRFTNAKGLEIHKTVVYFLARIDPSPSQPEPQVTIQIAELADYRWCTYGQGLELITFEASRGVLQECETYLQAESTPSL